MGKDLKGKELGECLSQKRDGRYCARFTNRFGKRIEFKNYNLIEVREMLNTAIYEDRMRLNVIDDGIKLDDWFETWIKVHKYKVIREHTKSHYIGIYKRHIAPSLGHSKLQDITNLKVRQLLIQLDKNGYKYETQNKVRILLLDMLDKAMYDDFLTGKNPARGIKLRRDEKVDPRVLTVAEQQEFFECCKGTFYDNLFTIAVSTGLRPGELCALTKDDIEFKKMEIDVNKTIFYQKLEGNKQKVFHIGPPKTNSSIRKVPINRQCELALKKQILQKDIIMSKTPKRVDEEFSDLLFTTKFGTPINSQIYLDAIKAIIKEINLTRPTLDEFEEFSPHCFRHTFATRCFEADIKPKTVQMYLGHATLQMTMDLYTHVLGKEKVYEMDKLENVLDNLLDADEKIIEKKYYDYEKENQKIVYMRNAR